MSDVISNHKNKSLEQKKAEVAKIRQKYPRRVPVMVYKHPKSKIANIDKNKFLVPLDMPLGSFSCVLRKRIKLQSIDAIYLFVGGSLAQSHATMGQIYQDHQDDSGYLSVMYSGERTFGC